MNRQATVNRKTNETEIKIKLKLCSEGKKHIKTSIHFLDHMLSILAVHGFLDLDISAVGDSIIDNHHLVEDIGLVLGEALNKALGKRDKIVRYGHAVIPMDDALCSVTIDLSNRPFLVYNTPKIVSSNLDFNLLLAKEFFRAFANNAGMNLHINVSYGEDEHHIIESIFKALAVALFSAVSFNENITDFRSSKGVI